LDETKLRQSESRGYLELAEEYFDGARGTVEIGHYRLAVDAAYNAAELCDKGFLILTFHDMPLVRYIHLNPVRAKLVSGIRVVGTGQTA
jgi:hypothetical protein